MIGGGIGKGQGKGQGEKKETRVTRRHSAGMWDVGCVGITELLLQWDNEYFFWLCFPGARAC